MTMAIEKIYGICYTKGAIQGRLEIGRLFCWVNGRQLKKSYE